MTAEPTYAEGGAMFTPQQFGAVGDGSSHTLDFPDAATASAWYTAQAGTTVTVNSLSEERDEVALRAAINAASSVGGGTVYIPPGTYLFGTLASIQMKSYVRLLGAGRAATHLKLKGSSGISASTGAIQIATAGTEMWSISSMRISGNKANQSSAIDGIHIDQTGGSGYLFNDSMPLLFDLVVDNFKGTGIKLGTTVRETRLISVRLNDCDGIGVHITGTDNILQGVSCGKSGLEGFKITNTNNQLINCKAFQAGQVTATNGDGFYLNANRQLLVGCVAQDNKQNGFYFLSASRSVARGLYSQSNGTGATGDGIVLDATGNLDLSGIATDTQGTPTQQYALNIKNSSTFSVIDVVGRTNVNAGITGNSIAGNLIRFVDGTTSIHQMVKHEGGSTPTGGYSGEIRVGTGKIWVNDGGTWKSATTA